MPFADEKDDSHANADGIADAVGGLLDGLSGEDAVSDDDLNADAQIRAELDGEPVKDDETVDEKPTEEAPVVEEDPLKDAPFLKYTVDGQEKSADFIKVYTEKDGTVRGAIVSAEQLPVLQQRLSKADYYETANKTLYEENRQFKSLGGVDKLQTVSTENAKLSEVVKHFAQYLDFENPKKLLELAFAAQEGDKAAWDRLVEQTQFVAERAAFNARQQWGTESTKHVTQQNEQEQRQAITTQSIAASVKQWSTKYPELTQDDKAKAIAHLNRIGSAVVRPASPEEARAAGVQTGALIIDHPVVADYLAERAELRKATAAQVKAQSTANSENAKRLAAASRGNTPKKPAPTSRTTPSEPEGETWAQQRERLQGGNFSTIDH